MNIEEERISKLVSYDVNIEKRKEDNYTLSIILLLLFIKLIALLPIFPKLSLFELILMFIVLLFIL